MSSPRRRLDVVVAELIGASRERARSLIIAGRVSVDGELRDKAGALVRTGANVAVAGDERYVSRGGRKLEWALERFGWSPDGLRCLDVGASTGGFTDCLLQHGAVSVTAVDVGYGQIAWKLRNDPRVHLRERCNFRHADPVALGAPFDFVCADVSFISLRMLAPSFAAALGPAAKLVALIKPQFEAGRQAVGRGGVVRDRGAQAEAICSVATALAAAGIAPQHLTYSPLVGPAGNFEFLVGAVRGAKPADIDAAGVVAFAHEALD